MGTGEWKVEAPEILWDRWSEPGKVDRVWYGDMKGGQFRRVVVPGIEGIEEPGVEAKEAMLEECDGREMEHNAPRLQETVDILNRGARVEDVLERARFDHKIRSTNVLAREWLSEVKVQSRIPVDVEVDGLSGAHGRKHGAWSPVPIGWPEW